MDTLNALLTILLNLVAVEAVCEPIAPDISKSLEVTM